MRLRASLLAALAVLSLSCAEEGESSPVSGQFVVSRFAVDPATPLGQLFLRELPTERDRELIQGLEDIFDSSACWAQQAFVVSVDAERTGVRGVGTASLLLVTATDDDELCGPNLEAVVQPSSYRIGTGEPIVGGPLYIEGQTLEARMSLGDVGQIVFAEAAFLPRWWSLRAQFTPLPGSGTSITEAEVSSIWSLRDHLQASVMNDPERRYGDELIRLGYQPDFDVDGDGLETMHLDENNRIDRCTDGPGSPEPRVIEGADCMQDPRIADGYLLQLRFQLYPIRLID